LHQLVGGQNIDPRRPAWIGQEKVIERQRGFPEKPITTLPLEHQKAALDRPDRGGRHIAIAQG
jgi:hypothetical protein